MSKKHLNSMCSKLNSDTPVNDSVIAELLETQISVLLNNTVDIIKILTLSDSFILMWWDEDIA